MSPPYVPFFCLLHVSPNCVLFSQRPGTLEHTVTLAIFKAQQSLNQIMGQVATFATIAFSFDDMIMYHKITKMYYNLQGDPITALLNQISGGGDSQQPVSIYFSLEGIGLEGVG